MKQLRQRETGEDDEVQARQDCREPLVVAGQAAEASTPGKVTLDGLLTNDKFCLTRTAVLPLSWSREALRLRPVVCWSRDECLWLERRISHQLLRWAEFKGQVRASDLHIKWALKRLRLKPVPSPVDTGVGLDDPAWAQSVLA